MTMAQCSAKAKSTGVQCRRRAVNGRNVCTVHGGLTPRGRDHPAFKHGRYSKHLPDRLGALVEQQIGDPDLLSLRDDVSLLDAITFELLENIDIGYEIELWKAAQKAYNDFQKAANDDRQDEAMAALTGLGNTLGQGLEVSKPRKELIGLLEQRRKTVDTERKHYLQMQEVITGKQFADFLSALSHALDTRVNDDGVIDIRAFRRDIDALLQ